LISRVTQGRSKPWVWRESVKVFGAGEVEIVGGEVGGGEDAERGMGVERWTLESESMPLGMERGGGGDEESI